MKNDDVKSNAKIELDSLTEAINLFHSNAYAHSLDHENSNVTKVDPKIVKRIEELKLILGLEK